MFYILNVGPTETVVVGLKRHKKEVVVADVFSVTAGDTDFINNTVPAQLMQSIPDFASNKYIVVCDAIYKCDAATVDEKMSNSREDLEQLKIINICENLLPAGLKKDEYWGTIMRSFPKTERQDFVSTAYFKKELFTAFKEYFAGYKTEIFAIYPEALVFSELLAANNYSEYILELSEGKYLYSAPQGIVVWQNEAYLKEDAVSFLYDFANELFERQPGAQIPPILSANKLDIVCLADLSGRYIPNSEKYKKEIYAALGACAAWSGKPHGRKPAPAGEASSGNGVNHQERGGKYSGLEAIWEFFTKARR